MESTKTNIAKLVSVIFSPPLMAILLLLAFNNKYSPNLLILFSMSIILIIPALIYIFYILIIKKVSDIDISNKKHRFILFLLIFISFVLTTIISILYIPSASLLLLRLTIFIALLTVISFYWKISIHSAFYTLTTLVYITLFDPIFLLFFMFLPLIWWSRLYLKKHTLNQLIFGSLIAFMIMI